VRYECQLLPQFFALIVGTHQHQMVQLAAPAEHLGFFHKVAGNALQGPVDCTEAIFDPACGYFLVVLPQKLSWSEYAKVALETPQFGIESLGVASGNRRQLGCDTAVKFCGGVTLCQAPGVYEYGSEKQCCKVFWQGMLALALGMGTKGAASSDTARETQHAIESRSAAWLHITRGFTLASCPLLVFQQVSLALLFPRIHGKYAEAKCKEGIGTDRRAPTSGMPMSLSCIPRRSSLE